MINFFKTLKANLKDPKKKSLTLLGLYFIFFIFVFIFINILENTDVPIKNNAISESNNITSYEYVYKIKNNTLMSEISGTYKDNVQLFNYNGEKYYLEDNKLYLVNIELIELDNILINPDIYSYNNINLLIDNSEFLEETTYKDGNKKITYEISANKFFELLNFENNCDLKDCSNIKINFVANSSEYINQVYIDLYGYYGYEYNVDITYKNINNIADLNLSYN